MLRKKKKTEVFTVVIKKVDDGWIVKVDRSKLNGKHYGEFESFIYACESECKVSEYIGDLFDEDWRISTSV